MTAAHCKPGGFDAWKKEKEVMEEAVMEEAVME
jgi:hypothetical protein